MENIRERTASADYSTSELETKSNIKERLRRVEEDIRLGKLEIDSEKEKKPFKFPYKWKGAMKKSTGKAAEDKVLMLYLNIKGEIEPPRLVPLYSGNIIIWKHKAYEFDPRASWTTKLGKKIVKCVIVREIDRRPVSNLDWDEVKARGDSTDSDEILVKMVTKAVMEKAKTQINKGIIIVIVIVIIVAIAAFLLFGRG